MLWVLIITTYFYSREYVKLDSREHFKEYPDRPLERKFIYIKLGGQAIGTSFFLSCILSNETHWLDMFGMLICIMLPTVWWSVETIFKESEKQGKEQGALLKEIERLQNALRKAQEK